MESDNIYGIQAGCGGITLRVTRDAETRQSPTHSNSIKVKKSQKQYLIKSSAVATFQSTKNVTATDVIDPSKFD